MRIQFPLGEEGLAERLRILLGALTLMDRLTLKAHPGLPRLYAAGVRYRREPPGHDEWIQTDGIYRRRWADCEDLGAARAAELQEFGEDPGAFADCRHHGRQWHTFVRRGDGSIEDPSRILGMGRRASSTW